MAKEIQLRNGVVTTVDDEDYDRLARYRWRATKGRRGAFYAVRMGWIPRQHPEGEARIVCRQMQRDVLDPNMELPRHLICDHINHDTLDNRKANLRIVDFRLSALNRRSNMNNSSGYRGVHFDIRQGVYYAQVGSYRVRYTSPYCNTAEEAASAYNALALQHHGEHARLNVGPDGLPFPPILLPHRKRGRKRIGDAVA